MLNMDKVKEIHQTLCTRTENPGPRFSTEIIAEGQTPGNLPLQGVKRDTSSHSNNLSRVISMTPEENSKRRKEILAALEEKMGCQIISYITNGRVAPSSMSKEDDIFLLDLIEQAARKSDKVAIIISSLGGDPDTSLKQVHTLRNVFKGGFQIFVPHRAKSAATLLALGADKIIMGEPSELGPIDPLLIINYDQYGASITIQAKLYLNSMEEAKKFIMSEKNRDIRQVYLKKFSEQFDYTTIKQCKDAIKTLASKAKGLLQNGAMRGRTPEEIDKTIEIMMNGEAHRDHGSMINSKEASSELKLNVETLGIHDEKWLMLLEYYELTDNLLNTTGILKLYESSQTSFMTVQKRMHTNAMHIPPSAEDIRHPLPPEVGKNESLKIAPILVNPKRK